MPLGKIYKIVILISLTILVVIIGGCVSNQANIANEDTITTNDTSIDNISDISEDNMSEDIPIDTEYIESEGGYAIPLDTDDDPDGLEVTLYRYNADGSVNKSEGTLDAILYENIENIEDGSDDHIKGKELDNWTVQVNESDYGKNGELVKILAYHDKEKINSIANNMAYGWMDYTFTTKDGQIFSTSDEYIRLVLE